MKQTAGARDEGLLRCERIIRASRRCFRARGEKSRWRVQTITSRIASTSDDALGMRAATVMMGNEKR